MTMLTFKTVGVTLMATALTLAIVLSFSGVSLVTTHQTSSSPSSTNGFVISGSIGLRFPSVVLLGLGVFGFILLFVQLKKKPDA